MFVVCSQLELWNEPLRGNIIKYAPRLPCALPNSLFGVSNQWPLIDMLGRCMCVCVWAVDVLCRVNSAQSALFIRLISCHLFSFPCIFFLFPTLPSHLCNILWHRIGAVWLMMIPFYILHCNSRSPSDLVLGMHMHNVIGYSTTIWIVICLSDEKCFVVCLHARCWLEQSTCC